MHLHFGCVLRRDCARIGRGLLRIEPPGRRDQQRLIDLVKEGMKLVAVREDDAVDGVGG